MYIHSSPSCLHTNSLYVRMHTGAHEGRRHEGASNHAHALYNYALGRVAAVLPYTGDRGIPRSYGHVLAVINVTWPLCKRPVPVPYNYGRIRVPLVT